MQKKRQICLIISLHVFYFKSGICYVVYKISKTRNVRRFYVQRKAISGRIANALRRKRHEPALRSHQTIRHRDATRDFRLSMLCEKNKKNYRRRTKKVVTQSNRFEREQATKKKKKSKQIKTIYITGSQNNLKTKLL